MRKRLLTARFPRDMRHLDDLSELCITPNVVQYLIEIFPILMFYMTFVTYLHQLLEFHARINRLWATAATGI